MAARGTKTYRIGPGRRLINRVYTTLTDRGLGAPYRHLLTVTGRRSGLPRTTPVDVMQHDGAQWLVAPYGEVEWVRNTRVDARVELRRGRHRHRYDAVEVDAPTAAPVIATYMRAVPVTRSWWGVGADASESALEDEARAHPVFRLNPLPAQAQTA